ncbi:MAG: recombinase family protein [Alphaproteobacteria bacterium]|nr:recombinase family protein [Alphaproteobacteria bacterium]
MTVYGYLRVSTDKQDCDNQKIGVEALANKLNLQIENWIIDDGVSGTKEPEKRKLGKLLRKIKSGDVIICSELSRLGRKLFMVISILEHCMKIGAKVLTAKEGYELGDNVQSKVLAFAFGLVAELEREMISKRTKEALQRRKTNGKAIGRLAGAKNKRHVLDGKEQKIIELLKSGKRKSAIAKEMKISSGTLYDFIKKQGL